MLFFFSPAGIETLFDALAEMDEPKGDFKSVIETLNVLGEKYGSNTLQNKLWDLLPLKSRSSYQSVTSMIGRKTHVCTCIWL